MSLRMTVLKSKFSLLCDVLSVSFHGIPNVLFVSRGICHSLNIVF